MLILSVHIVLAATYGNLRFGKELYGRGEAPPVISLIDPLNNSGTASGNISFSYNVSDDTDILNCSLIINNKINITDKTITKNILSNFLLNRTEVSRYNWSINCTDSAENIGESPKRAFIHNQFTNFNETVFNLSAVDLRNVTNFVVATSGFGKINFSESLDLSEGFDLNKHIVISLNKIELNSSALPALNKSATLEIEGLTFNNPRIVRDGAVCPDTICKKVTYLGGRLVFNVTQWSSYSAEETPSTGGDTGSGASTTSAGGGGGGGGGGGPSPIPIVTDFSVDKTTMKVMLKQGQSKTETLSIKNTGTTIFEVEAHLSEIEKFKVSPQSNQVTTILQPNEEKTIEFVFKALENEKPDIYPAKIRLKGPSTEKEIDTVIEVDSAEPLFDVDVEVLSETKKVFPGEELLLEVNLFNVRGFGRVDVGVEYAIKDFKGDIVAAEHETLAVETQAKFTRSLLVPSDLRPGTYVAIVKVTYGDSVGASSDVFEVKAKTIKLYPIEIKDYRFILLGIILVLVVGIAIFSVYKFGYKKIPKTKAEEVKDLLEGEKAQKLKKELEAIESARKAGFISEEAYQRDKKRIEEKLKGFKSDN